MLVVLGRLTRKLSVKVNVLPCLWKSVLLQVNTSFNLTPLSLPQICKKLTDITIFCLMIFFLIVVFVSVFAVRCNI